VNSYIYIEGGGSGPDSKDLNIRCREGFRKLLENCGFAATKRMPRLVACGGRGAAFDKFAIAHSAKAAGDFVALWLDSEEPIDDIEAAWQHLRQRDQWTKPAGALDEQVLFMTTCMETWFVADRAALTAHFEDRFQDSALPPLNDLERRRREDVQRRLINATRQCSNPYAKGIKSYELLGNLSPSVLEQYLPSFLRIRRILGLRL
jgi:hypothetical protein